MDIKAKAILIVLLGTAAAATAIVAQQQTRAPSAPMNAKGSGSRQPAVATTPLTVEPAATPISAAASASTPPEPPVVKPKAKTKSTRPPNETYAQCVDRGFERCNQATVGAALKQIRTPKAPRPATTEDLQRQQCAIEESRARREAYRRQGVVVQPMVSSCTHPYAQPKQDHRQCLNTMQQRCIDDETARAKRSFNDGRRSAQSVDGPRTNDD